MKQAILQAAQEDDDEVKEKYGDPVTVKENYKSLKISVYYDFADNPEVKVVTYIYKEETE